MSLEVRDFAHGASFIMGARDLGVETLSAIYELVDNSIDADAENIHVHIEENVVEEEDGEEEYLRIYVEDDGRGISQVIEDEGTEYDGITYALAFGDRYEQGGIQIGKFGWGLPAASTCTSLRTEVYTKQKDEDNWRYSYVDLDEMEEERTTRPPESEQKAPSHLELEDDDKESGTVVSFEKCDDTEPKTVNGIESQLISELPRIYRYYLDGDLSITVNGTDLEPKDPLFRMENAHNVGELPDKVPRAEETYLEETIHLEGEDDEEHAVNLTVVFLDVEKIRKCDEWDPDWMSDHGLVERNQGFSLVRNGREIRNGLTLGLFKRHSDKNYMRAEIDFPPELDSRFGIQTDKSRLSPEQAVKDKIGEAFGKTDTRIQKKTREKITKLKAEAKKEESDANPSPSERSAEKASKFMKSPRDQTSEEEKEVNEEVEEKKKEEIQEIAKDSDLDEEEKEEKIEQTEKKYERQKDPNSLNITTDTLGNGNFFQPEFRGQQVNATINDGHQFYEEYQKVRTAAHRVTDGGSSEQSIDVMVEGQTEGSMLVDHLILAAARAELMMKEHYDYDDELEEYLYQFRSNWSEALRTFLKYADDGQQEAISDL